MQKSILTFALLCLLCGPATSEDASAKKSPEEPKSKAEAYQAALNTVAENIGKATEKSEALITKHMSAVSNDPGTLITKEAMQKLMQGSSFLPQKAGTRSILLEAQQGFNGISNYQPSGWKIVETMSAPKEKSEEPAVAKPPAAVTYPAGVGPALLNGCTATTEYSKTSPCYNSKLFDLQNTICAKIMDAANFIGVGFDGRGYYRAESRRGSLIQRVCARKSTFMGQDVPDTMNVFGIYETTAETKSFQSVDEYMAYIRNKAGLSEQKNLFTSEASKYSKASAFGFNLGGIGSMIGGAIGAVAGGPVGAAMGATAGGAIGGSIGGGTGSGSGSESATDKGTSSSNMQQTEQESKNQAATQNFFAIMFVNVVLYEITLDDVKPSDINLAALRDYMALPVSYYSAGADVKYQNFLLRWGTHFIRSAKFGGQLKITKTAKTDKSISEQQFASIAETEFQSMFSTLQSKWSQESSSWGFLGFGGESKQTSQESSAKAASGYTGTLSAKNQQSQSFRQSEFTQTTVDAQGGTPEIAEALVDFYTPAFKQLFHDWIVSIKDYAKPFEFQLRPVNELFNLNMDLLFPAGNMDFGCVGSAGSKVEILTDPDTKARYYLDKYTEFANNVTVEKMMRVNCKYSSLDDFKQDMERRMVSLEKAVRVYMAEGPFPTSSFELKGGEPGCEEATVAQLHMNNNSSVPLTFAELSKQSFIIAFNLPESVPGIVTMEAKYVMIYRLNRWFAVEPGSELINLFEGCQVAQIKATDQKICFRNIILTYEESTGLFKIEKADFDASKLRIPSLPYWLSGTTVARARKMFQPVQASGADMVTVPKKTLRESIPCNLKWLNSHRLDPSKSENCLHFTAASEGDLFLVFASIPKDHTTWYYLQINIEGVSFYQGLSLQKSDLKKGMGLLGDSNLYHSFFVCVIQKQGTVTMQYGKADPDSEVGTVYSAYTFLPDSQFNQLSYYSFGTGTKPASLMDVRQTRKMPVVACLGDDYVKKDGQCILACHAECKGCKVAKDSKGCQQCLNVRIETGGTGADRVTECVAQCPQGMYLSDTREALCVSCDAGTFKATPGNEKCTKCPVGTSSSEGASTCAGCPAGTYSDSGQRCEKCPAGQFAPSGARSCSNCAVGTFSEAGKGECDPCPYGHFGSAVGLASCEQCAAGFYADKRGMTACTPCPAGSSSARGSMTCANNCVVGEFSPKVGVACAKCPVGSYAESAGSTACSACAVGYYQSSAGQARCNIAPRGSYVPGTGATAYQACPAGTFNDHEGQSSSSACRPCSTGSYTPGTGYASCTQCSPGQFQPNTGQTACVPAGPGYFVNGMAASSQSPCPAGRVSGNSGATGCSQCGAGQFASAGSSVCSSCSEFQYANAGSGSCTDCPSGALVKSDRINCYRRISFLVCNSNGALSADNACSRATDGNRYGTPFISVQNGPKVWVGAFAPPITLRRVVLWRRLDCCPDQFIGIQVIALTGGGPRQCGTVDSAAKAYYAIQCDAQVVVAIQLYRPTGSWIAVTEVEAYTD